MKQDQSNLIQLKNNKQTITFTSNRYHLSENSISCPKNITKSLPLWYKNADLYAIDPYKNEPFINPQDGGKIPTWKACPAILDVMTTGYVLTTPCDIEFYNNGKRIMAKINDINSKDFIQIRDPLPQFVHPMGYDEYHFAWWIDWGISVPEGYSVLYTHPMNRFDLPFISTSGIVDNDNVNLPGTLPFFVFKGWTGVISAGTPYSQIIPFKREDWISDIVIEDTEKIKEKNILNSLKYRVKNGGIYKNKVWKRRSYK